MVCITTSYNKNEIREAGWCEGRESQTLEVVHESCWAGISFIAPDVEITLNMEIKNVNRSRSLRWVADHYGEPHFASGGWRWDQDVIGRIVFGAIDDEAFRLKGEFLENRRRSDRSAVGNNSASRESLSVSRF